MPTNSYRHLNQAGSWKIIIVPVLTFLFGGGVIWQFMDTRLNTQKLELERIVKTTELRKQENDLYDRIIELSNEYSLKRDAALKAPEGSEKSILNNKMRELRFRLNVAKDDFISVEGKLSHLEDRAPRNIELEFIVPAAPHSLKISVE